MSDYYGTSGNFERKFAELKTDDDRKKEVMNVTNKLLGEYIDNASKNKDLDYSDLEKAKELKSIVDSGKWDQFVEHSSKNFKWEPTGYMLTDKQKSDLEEEAKALAEKEKATKAKETYDKLKIAPELQELLYQSGFTEQNKT